MHQEQRLLRPEFYEEVLCLWERYPKKDKSKTQKLQEVLDNCSNSTTKEQFVALLKKEKGFTKGEAIEYIKSKLIPTRRNPNNVSTNAIKQQPLFPRGEILEDAGWISECEDKIHLTKAKKQFRKDAEWLFQEYNTGKYKSETDKSPHRFIEHLKNLLSKKLRESRRDFTSTEIQNIIQYLNQEYGIG